MTFRQLKRKISLANGLHVTDLLAGEPAGSIFYLTFGINEYLLYVYCSWRLVKNNNIITGWHESNKVPDGPLTKGIKSLEGDVVIDIVLNQFYDLNIKFGSGKELQVFCDITPNLQEDEYIDENWDFSMINENTTYTIYKDQSIKVGKYDSEID